MEVVDTGLPLIQVRPTLDTLRKLLDWGRDKKKTEVAAFRSKVEITNIQTKNSRFNFTCTGGNCRKGVSRQRGKFWCHSCKTDVKIPRTCAFRSITGIILSFIGKRLRIGQSALTDGSMEEKPSLGQIVQQARCAT